MIKIKVDDKEVRQLLSQLQGKAEDMSPVMRSIAGVMLDAVEENFEKEGRPTKWKPLSPATLAQRKREGKDTGKILQKSGQLAASISTKATSTSAMVGTNKRYAAIQHFGGKAGRGLKVTIPARPYMLLTDEDVEEIKDVILRYLKGGES